MSVKIKNKMFINSYNLLFTCFSYKGEGSKTSASRTYKATKKSTLKSGSLDSLKKVSTLKVSVSWFSNQSVAVDENCFNC